jgi:hypothetical protein
MDQATPNCGDPERLPQGAQAGDGQAFGGLFAARGVSPASRGAAARPAPLAPPRVVALRPGGWSLAGYPTLTPRRGRNYASN